MRLDKNDIQQLQKSLVPAQKKFNIIQVIQKFADNPHMHQTFRQICLHYESSSISFKQIIQYLFSQFNQNTSQQPYQGQQNKKSSKMRIKKNNSKQDMKIILLKLPNSNTIQRIKELVVVDDQKQKQRERDREGLEELYAVTNTTVREYHMSTGGFQREVVKVEGEVLGKVGITGGLVMFVTANSQLYLQVLPHKLIEINKAKPNKKSSQEPIDQIGRYFIHKFSQPVIFLSPLNQQEWIACTAHSLTIIKIPLTQSTQSLSPTLHHLQIPPSSSTSSPSSIQSVCKLAYPYVGLLSTQKSIMIVDVVRMKITNTMGNDSHFTTFCYNAVNRLLVVADFGGYLMALSFNQEFGDVEEHGIGIRKNPTQPPLPPDNELFSTRYLQRKPHLPNPPKNDTIFNKEVRTKYTTIVQNSFRNPLQLLTTKQQAVFSYESKYHRSIKLWNIATLQVYQKIQLNLEIYQMKVSGIGLYLVSREKGYLCYYPFEDQDYGNSRKQNVQILDVCIDSNMMFVNTTNMTDNVVYKLRLSNKPTLSEYSRKTTKNAQKSLKYAFYKNEVMLFNLIKSQSPVLEVTGIFGQSKQVIKDLRSYHSMVRFPNKQGIILWGDRKVHIRCKLGHRAVIRKHYNKGQHIFENEPRAATSEQTYTRTITMSQPISKVKCFENYITIICYIPKQEQQKSKQKQKQKQQILYRSNCYLIDENTLCLSMIYSDLSEEYRILQSHKYCSLVMQTRPKQLKTYFLYDHKDNKRIWQAEQIQGWHFQSVQMVNVTAKQVDIICIYKSATISSQSNQTKPLFYLQKTKLALCAQQKNFVNLSNQSMQTLSECQTIQQIKSRSIYHKIKPKQIETTAQQQQQGIKSNYKIFFPNSQILPKKYDDFQMKSAEGKILHYEKAQGVLMFGVVVSGLTILYQMETQIVAEIIGVLSFQKIQSEEKLKECIVYWNPKYKKDDEELWQEVKNNALRRLKNKNSTPLPLSRSDSLRSTNKKWNPENHEQTVLPIIEKRSKSYNKMAPVLDTQRVNQLIHKHNIHQNIIKQKSQNEKKSKNKTETKLGETEKGIKPFTLQMKPVSEFKLESPIKLSTQQLSTGIKTILNQQRYQTEADYPSKLQIVEKTLQQSKKSRQPSLLLSEAEGLIRPFETNVKEDRVLKDTKHPSLRKLKTQYSANETSLDSPLSPKKLRFQTESQQVLPKFKNQQPMLNRNSSKSRNSNFKSQQKLYQTKQPLTHQNMQQEIKKKEVTFADLIRQTQYPTDEASTHKVSIKTQQSTKKHRYKTEPHQQLQKSRQIAQSLLPHLPEAQEQSVRTQIYEKSLIFNMLSKQRYMMNQSLLNHNLSKLAKVQQTVKAEVKQMVNDIETKKKMKKPTPDKSIV